MSSLGEPMDVGGHMEVRNADDGMVVVYTRDPSLNEAEINTVMMDFIKGVNLIGNELILAEVHDTISVSEGEQARFLYTEAEAKWERLLAESTW